ncbi:hypothetical protein N7489_009186 [Penicillium chrysogenum]|uniref:uncharacterized protein n=1 Tax=Penicillium chrysogenum TaxID=5076 RepID=UPI0024DF2E80|nr:uncharacterized protein N7489_009186 [Penicillium chrysogenum]KAJ5228478.1 hypothetical protein N7489_009186 [Penicillium chrysogenum]
MTKNYRISIASFLTIRKPFVVKKRKHLRSPLSERRNNISKINCFSAWRTYITWSQLRITRAAKIGNQLELLSSASSSELFDNFIEKRIEGTYDWVLDQPLFRDWTSATFPDSRAKILWINGPIGFGKSFIYVRITDSLSSSLKDPLGHFFISSDFEDRKDPFTVIRSWISQLFQHLVIFSLVREI